jgi:hypothetical protein
MQLPLDLNLIQHLLNSSTVTGDLNNLTTTGFYYVQDAVNAPTTAWPHVFVNANDDKTKVVQLALPDQGNEGLFYRCYNVNAWSEWFNVSGPNDFENTSHLTSIPESQWVPNGVTIDDYYFFRHLSLLKLGADALVTVDLQFTTTAQLNPGWNQILSFPTSYMTPYLGNGSTCSLAFESSTPDKITEVGIERPTGRLTFYAPATIPAGTMLNAKGIILLAKDTNLLNVKES